MHQAYRLFRRRPIRHHALTRCAIRLAVATVFFVGAAKHAAAQAGGVLIPYWPVPAWEKCFINSKTIVVGTASNVQSESIEHQGQKYDKVTYDLEIQRTLFGKASSQTLSIRDYHNRRFGKPKEGETYIVYLRRHPPRPNSSEGPPDGNVYYASPLKNSYWKHPEAILRAGKIWMTEDVQQQVAAIKSGCFSANPSFRAWCIRQMTGTRIGHEEDPRTFPIHDHIDRGEARRILLQSLHHDAEDYWLVLDGFSRLHEDGDYDEREACYRLVLGLLDRYDSEPRDVDHQKLQNITRLLVRHFPERGVTTAERLAKLAHNTELDEGTRIQAIARFDNLYLVGDDATKEAVLDLLESFLFASPENKREPMPRIAAQVFSRLVEAIAKKQIRHKKKQLPPRLAKIIARADDAHGEVAKWIRSTGEQAEKILQGRADQ